jgi:hypothetical protein
MNADEIVGYILGSATDDELENIQNAVTIRKDNLARMKAATLKVGTPVVVGGDLRPKYLQGLSGTVLKVNRTRADIKLSNPSAATLYPRYVRPGGILPGVPLVCLMETK